MEKENPIEFKNCNCGKLNGHWETCPAYSPKKFRIYKEKFRDTKFRKISENDKYLEIEIEEGLILFIEKNRLGPNTGSFPDINGDYNVCKDGKLKFRVCTHENGHENKEKS